MRIRASRLRFLGLLCVVAMLLALGFAADPAQLLDPEALRRTARTHLYQAIALFVLVGTGIKLLFVPLSPVSIVAGLVFGGVLGGSLAFTVLLLSSLLSFGLARVLGRSLVEDLIDDETGKLRFVERLLREHGLLAVVVLRVVPTLPLSAVNVLLGHSSVRVRDFVLGTALGILPGTYVLAFVGSESLDPTSARFWAFVALSALLVLAGLVGGLRLRRRLRT